MTASAIYEAEIHHRRNDPGHSVRQRLRLAYLDLEELPDVVRRRRGWSTGPAPVWFRRRDYLDGSDRPLRDALGDLIEERTGRRAEGPVRMLTQLRTFGWLFNPLTTYYCFEPDGETLAFVVLEITNTPWHERHWYVLDAAQVTHPGAPFPKAFHVSPFLPMDLTYRCQAPPPGGRLDLRFALSAPGPDGEPHPVFHAALSGRRLPLDAPPPLGSFLRVTSQTVRVSAGIYVHAAALRWRGARFHAHPHRGRAVGAAPRPPAPLRPTANQGPCS